ncbi:MAG TPA: competence protein ComE, partial [Cyanobacteria bacterium UBA11368]|nr:competence protein ComE [Cyanobacteria bacterium UBA11368]
MFSLSSCLRLGSIVLLALTGTACQQVRSQNTRPQPLPQDAFVEVYFNHSQASEYIEPLRNQRRDGDNLEQVIVDAIASANSTIDIAVQEFRLPEIAQALADRKKAGVKVRIILENNYNSPFKNLTAAELEKMPERERDRYQEFRYLIDSDRDNNITPDEINNRDALLILKQAGIPIIDDTADGSKGSSLMHHKFVI